MIRKSSRSAFTLVELLVVIGIISVLISILLPALNKARTAALEVVCQSNLRQFGIGAEIYADQNQGFLPQKGPDGSTPAGSNEFGGVGSGVVGFNDASIWFNAIPPYLRKEPYYQQLIDDYEGTASAPKSGSATTSIFICPAAGPPLCYPAAPAQDIVLNGYYLLYGFDSTGLVKNPTGLAVNKQFKFDFSYVWNSKLTSVIGGTDNQIIKLCQCRPSSEVVLMVEKMANYGEYSIPAVQQYAASCANEGKYAPNKITRAGLDNNVGQAKSTYTRFTTRHRGGGYLLFADSHVAWFPWQDTQIPLSHMVGGYFNANTTDANQPGKIIWCPLGPTG